MTDRLQITRKDYWKVGNVDHAALTEAFQDATNQAMATPGTVISIVGAPYEIVYAAASDAPVDPPTDPVKAVSQSLVADKPTVMVGDYVTVTGTLTMSDGSPKPLVLSHLSWDRAKLSAPNGFTPRFLAIAPGEVNIRNDDSKTTGKVTVTVVANDGTVFPPDPPADPNPPADPPPTGEPPTDPVDPPPPVSITGQTLTVSNATPTEGERSLFLGSLPTATAQPNPSLATICPGSMAGSSQPAAQTIQPSQPSRPEPL